MHLSYVSPSAVPKCLGIDPALALGLSLGERPAPAE